MMTSDFLGVATAGVFAKDNHALSYYEKRPKNVRPRVATKGTKVYQRMLEIYPVNRRKR